MHTLLPACLAVFAAMLVALGTVLRQRATTANGGFNRSWWLGAFVVLFGFGLQAAALAFGSILLVQPLLVLAVLFALPLEAWLDHRHPRRIEWVWGATLVMSVAVFLIFARPRPSDDRPNHIVLGLTVGAILAVLVFFVVVAERSQPHYRALFYGLTAGACFGITVLLVKTVIHQVIYRGWEYPLHRPEVYLFLVVTAAGIVAQQRGFGSGDLQTSFPAMAVAEPAISMILGIVLLGERVHVDPLKAFIIGAVLVVMIRSVIELARLSAIRGH